MPITLNGDGTVGGVTDFTDVDGGDFVATSVETTGNLLVHEVSANRYTLRVDETNNTVGINTSSAPAAGTFLQIADATDPIVSLDNTGNGEVRLGCTSTGGYIGTESNHPFNIETNSTTAVTVLTNGNVGIGTTSPSPNVGNGPTLHINGVGETTEIRLTRSDGTDASITGGSTAGGLSIRSSELIKFETNGSNERVRIADDGKVGINETATSSCNGLIVTGYDTSTTNYLNADAEILIRSTNEKGPVLKFEHTVAGTSNTAIVWGTGQALEFRQRENLVATFTSSRNLAFPNGQGIDFSAATGGIGTVDNSLLDDYEEGIWTPRITFDGVAFDGTFSVPPSGNYIKVGQIVHCWWGYRFSSLGTHPASAALAINDLPYSALYLASYKHPVGSMIITDATTNNLVAMPFAAAGNQLNFRNSNRSDQASDDATVDISDLASDSSGFGSIILYAVS